METAGAEQATSTAALVRHLVQGASFVPLQSDDAPALDAPDTVARIPELAPLAERFDHVLVRSDGLSFEVVCVKDRTVDPEARAGVDLETLRDVGRECLKYTGKVQGVQMPVAMRVVEVRRGGAPDVAGLQPLRALAGSRKVAVVAASVDIASGHLWTNARVRSLSAFVRELERATSEVVAGRAPTREAQPPTAEPPDGRPLVTWALLGALALVFVVQVILLGARAIMSPGAPGLDALGALSRDAVLANRQWYRLVSAGFLHGGIIHLGLNALALYFGGRLVETFAGRAWLLAVYFISLIGGAGASLLLNGPEVVSVGASGAIMGVLAAALLLTYRMPFGFARTRARVQLTQWLIPALIPIAISPTGGKIDFGAHLGGAVAGALAAAALLAWWPARRPWPHPPAAIARHVGRLVAAVGVIAMVLGTATALKQSGPLRRDLALRSFVAPDETFQGLGQLSPEDLDKRLAELRSTYPRDPRTWFFSGAQALSRKDLDNAEKHLRRALEEKDMFRVFFANAKLETATRLELAALLIQRGAPEEGKKVLEPACTRGDPEQMVMAEWARALCEFDEGHAHPHAH